MLRPATMLVLALVVVPVVAACGLVPPPLQQVLAGRANEPLVVVTAEGGLCADGSCTATATFAGDGLVTRSDGTADRVPPDEWAAIRRSIAATDWSAVLARPFNGTCPTAFDGTELTFRFALGNREVTVGSCDVEIDWAAQPFAGLAPWVYDEGR